MTLIYLSVKIQIKRRLKHCYQDLSVKIFLKIMFHKKKVGERLINKKLVTFCEISLSSGAFVTIFSLLLQRVCNVFLYYALLCVAVVYNWGYWNILAQKIISKKFVKLMKSFFKLYQVFIRNLLFQNVSIPLSCILPTHSKSIFTTLLHFYHLPTLSVKIGPIPLFHPLTSTDPIILLNAKLHALILHLSFFKCLAIFKFITPSQKLDYIFYIYSWFSSTYSFVKLIVSDILML